MLPPYSVTLSIVLLVIPWWVGSASSNRTLCGSSVRPTDICPESKQESLYHRSSLAVEIPEFVLPIETGARKRRVRQPGDRDVVEDVVAREALRLSVKDARDELVAALVVIKEIRRQTDR